MWTTEQVTHLISSTDKAQNYSSCTFPFTFFWTYSVRDYMYDLMTLDCKGFRDFGLDQ
jgi:hypothetical protein